MSTWEREDTERWLNDYPLPQDLTWRGEVVWPRYQLKHGYGQWLRTAGSYHPALRGLFVLVHDLLAAVPIGQPMPTPDELVAQLKACEHLQGTLGLEDEETPPAAAMPEIGRGVDFASKLKRNQRPPDAATTA